MNLGGWANGVGHVMKLGPFESNAKSVRIMQIE